MEPVPQTSGMTPPLLDERVMPQTIQVKYTEPDITEFEIQAVTNVLESGWLSSGPKVLSLESLFSNHTGKTALATSSGALAQLCGMKAWMDIKNIEPGSDVVVSGLAAPQTVLNILHLGLTPVFADVHPDTLQPTMRTIQAAKTRNTVAVVVTHYGGYPCPMAELWEYCKFRSLQLFDDASWCLPTLYKQWKDGSWPSDMTWFTFDATKMPASGDGGVICIKSGQIADKAREYRMPSLMHDLQWDVDTQVLGYKASMSDLTAGLIMSQMQRMEEAYRRRVHVWNAYAEAFADMECLDSPWPDGPGVRQSCQIFPIRVHRNRDVFIQGLRSKGVMATTHFRPVYEMSLWDRREKPKLAVLDEFWSQEVSLPIYSKLTQAQVKHVIQAVHETCSLTLQMAEAE
jgi:perosamine synthetase